MQNWGLLDLWDGGPRASPNGNRSARMWSTGHQGFRTHTQERGKGLPFFRGFYAPPSSPPISKSPNFFLKRQASLQRPSRAGLLAPSGPLLLAPSPCPPTPPILGHPVSPAPPAPRAASRRSHPDAHLKCVQLGGVYMEEFRRIPGLAHLSTARRKESSRPGLRTPSTCHSSRAGTRLTAITLSAESDYLLCGKQK